MRLTGWYLLLGTFCDDACHATSGGVSDDACSGIFGDGVCYGIFFGVVPVMGPFVMVPVI